MAVYGEDAAVGEQVAGLKGVVRGKLGEAGVLLQEKLVLALTFAFCNQRWAQYLPE